MRQFRTVAIAAGIAALAFAPASAVGGGKEGGEDKSPPSKCSKQKKKGCPKVKRGRMTGHGQIVTAEYGKVQWEFRNSVCGADRFPDLKVQWGDGRRFVLTAYTTPLRCLDTPADEGNPRAGFDTIVGQGTGRLDGRPASATFRFTDNGEPGRDDTASITIIDENGDIVLELDDVTAADGGNHQAHRLTGRAAR